MFSGLARDGGLYVPSEWPKLSFERIARLAGKSYEETAFEVMHPFIDGCFDDIRFQEIINEAYQSFRHPARCPLVQTGPNQFLLELFHGPTLAFKDVAMQLIGKMFEDALKRRGGRITIVGATSGDTGSSAIEAFKGLEAIDVFIMYPHGRVSEVQRRQMTTPDAKNVHALAVDGDFDTCQALLKDMFNDLEFRDEVHLAGVNSINWARILAQVVYYFSAAVSLGVPHRKVNFCVPTGNFGDIFAGYVAKSMGLPIDQLIIATNQNDILARTFDTGAHVKRGARASLSPSMDIEVSSNFERLLFELYNRDGAVIGDLMTALKNDGRFDLTPDAMTALKSDFGSGRALEDETLTAISKTYEETGELLCPHTAVGQFVSQKHLSAATPMVTLATAHPAKFPDAVEKATGIRPLLPDHLSDLFSKKERITRVGKTLDEVKTIIKSRIIA